MTKDSLVKEHVDFAKVGEQISHELGAKMVKNHHDAHGYDASYSYIIGGESIMDVLSQPGCVAVRFVDAIDESGKHTLVYVGLDANGNNIMEISRVDPFGKISVTPAALKDKSIVDGSWF